MIVRASSAAWANGVAVRELDFHDTFLAAEYSHPGDNIPPILAVAQHAGWSGARPRPRPRHRLRNPGRSGGRSACTSTRSIMSPISALRPRPASARCSACTPRRSTGGRQALHVTTATRQSRKGEISSWKAYAPAFAGKMAIEAVDRAMRGEGAPSADLGRRGRLHRLAARRARGGIHGAAARAGRAKRAILDTYTKEHSAEYQSQALIDLARRHGPEDRRLSKVAKHRHPHQPPHPLRDRHRRQRSAEDGPEGEPRNARPFDHVHLRGRAAGRQLASRDNPTRPSVPAAPTRSRCGTRSRRSKTPNGPRRYHSHDPNEKAFGGRVVVMLKGGRVISDEIAVADAHPLGARPFSRADYVRKFRTWRRA